MEVLDIIRDECQKLDKRLAYIGITSLCTAEHDTFVGSEYINVKLQITYIDGTERNYTHSFQCTDIPRLELRPATRFILRLLLFNIINEVSE